MPTQVKQGQYFGDTQNFASFEELLIELICFYVVMTSAGRDNIRTPSVM